MSQYAYTVMCITTGQFPTQFSNWTHKSSNGGKCGTSIVSLNSLIGRPFSCDAVCNIMWYKSDLNTEISSAA